VLAPGVTITIPPDPQEAETVTKSNVVEILDGIPGWSGRPSTIPKRARCDSSPPAPSFAATSGAWSSRSSRCE
jgi:hypothetical protein